MVISLPMGQRGKVKVIRVHKALAEVFIPNPNNFPVVHHIDENKTNNSLSNLEWTTHKGNTIYHLQESSKETSFFNNRKLTQVDVEYIRDNPDNLSNKKLAEMFGVSTKTISNARNGIFYTNGVW